MKLNVTKRVAGKMMFVQSAAESISRPSLFLSDNINSGRIIAYETDSLRTVALDLLPQLEVKMPLEKVMLRLFLHSLLESRFGSDNIFLSCYLDEIRDRARSFDAEEMAQNPYIKNIKFPKKRIGDFEFHYMSYKPYELFIYDTPKSMQSTGCQVPSIGWFTKEFTYPAISQISTGCTWMTVTPNEICTMKNAINNAAGKVLTLGCGMGYYTYMASLKENVSSVTVVEREQDVIDLFTEYILPQFQHKEKINIIKADAVEYLCSINDGDYDYCFADIWQNSFDHVPYFAVKEVGRNFRKTKFDYWIEDSLCFDLIQHIWLEMLSIFVKSLSKESLPNVIQDEMFLRKSRYVHNLMKKVEIKTPEQIDYYLNPKNIISMINKTKIIF